MRKVLTVPPGTSKKYNPPRFYESMHSSVTAIHCSGTKFGRFTGTNLPNSSTSNCGSRYKSRSHMLFANRLGTGMPSYSSALSTISKHMFSSQTMPHYTRLVKIECLDIDSSYANDVKFLQSCCLFIFPKDLLDLMGSTL